MTTPPHPVGEPDDPEPSSVAFVEREYKRLRPRLDDLDAEVTFIIERALAATAVKTHSVTHRIKKLESTRDKLLRQGSKEPRLDDLRDLVGFRIVVLFLSDLPKTVELIRASFDVVDEDDRISASGSEQSLGYMSHHFAVRLPRNARGPRYDAVRDMVFEIQVRTLLMDAWANVSHYLDYKGPTSIPEHLRRDFYALSGLFYVADKHFELFFGESLKSQHRAGEVVAADDLANVPVDLDTLQALLRATYPDRDASDRSELSQLTEQLNRFGYTTIAAVKELLTRNAQAALQYEQELIRGGQAGDPVVNGIFFSEVGIARACLRQEVDNIWAGPDLEEPLE